MAIYDLTAAVPYRAVHVGEYIKDDLGTMSQFELSKKTGIPASTISYIINGKRGITPKQARLIGDALGQDGSMYYRLQSQYEYDSEAIRQREVGFTNNGLSIVTIDISVIKFNDFADIPLVDSTKEIDIYNNKESFIVSAA